MKLIRSMSIYALLMNQKGFINFGFQRPMVMAPENDGGGGGGGGKTAEELAAEKKAADDKAAADKKAADDKKKNNGDGDDELDLESLDPKIQKLIKGLRKEAGDNRVKKTAADEKLKKVLSALGVDDGDEETPESKITKLQGQTEALQVRAAYLELAVEHGIPKDQFDFFEFSMNKACEGLAEDEELSEEAFEAILEKVKVVGGGAANTTSTGGTKAPPKKKDEVTIEQFRKMGLTEKTKLYQTNKELYETLMKQR